MFPNLPTEAPPSLSSAQSRRSSYAHLPCHWNWMCGPSCPKKRNFMWIAEDLFKFPPKQHFLRCGAFRRSFKRCVFGRSGGFEAGAVRGWHCSLCSALRCGAVCPCLPSHTDRPRKWDEQSRHKQLAQVRTGWETRFSLLRLTLLLSLAVKEDSPTKRAVEEREVTISCGIQRTDGLKQNQLVW